MTNAQLVQKIADGFSVVEIAKETGINQRTLEKRIKVLKKEAIADTVAHLVAKYLRKNIIE